MSSDRVPTPIEQKLTAYWCELLGVEVVKPEDHFIQLGGNSLLATMLANRIEEDLGVRPSMVELLNTLEQVAVVCEDLIREQGGSPPTA